MTTERVLIFVGSNPDDHVIRIGWGDKPNADQPSPFVFDDADYVVSGDAFRRSELLVQLVKTVRRVGASVVLFAAVHEDIPFDRIDAAKFLFENVPAVSAVYSFSARRIGPWCDGNCYFQVGMYKIVKNHITPLKTWDRIASDRVLPELLQEINLQSVGAVAA